MPATSSRRRIAVPWTLLLLYLGAIFYVSSKPQVDLPSLGFGLNDKIVHFKVYGLLGFLAAWSLRRTCPTLRWGSIVGIAFLVGTLYGVSDEFHQTFVPGRTAEVGDVVADALGSTLGALAYFFLPIALRRFIPRRRREGTPPHVVPSQTGANPSPQEALSTTERR